MDGTQARQALETLCQAYWYPLYAFARRKGPRDDSGEEARDLTQGFFTHLLSHQLIARAEESRGRFRSYLLKSFTRYMADQSDRSTAAKRGGGQTLLSLDFEDAEGLYRIEPADVLDPEKIFERRWAVTLVELTLQKLEAEFGRAGKGNQFALLKPYLLAEEDRETTTVLADRLGLTPTNLRVTLHRMRQRYRELFRQEVAETVSSPDELEDELHHIFRVLAS